MHTACVWSEKLPFARYSIVKDHSGLCPEPRLGRSRGPFAPLRSLARRAVRALPVAEKSFKDRRRYERLFSSSPKPEAKGYGEYRARTGDLLVANQALSQLS